MAKKKLYDESGNEVKGAKVKKPFYKKVWFWALAIIVVFLLIPTAGEDEAKPNSEPAKTEVTTDSSKVDEEEVVEEDSTEEEVDEEEAKKKEQEEKEKAKQEAEKAKEEEVPQFDPNDYNKELTFDDLARNPSEHSYKAVTFEGKILQVMQGDEYSQYRIATNDNYDKVMLIQISSDQLESRILEDDYIRFYGTYIGEHTYKSTLGGNITIPAVVVDKFEMK